jgi:hypothetical protein
LGFIRRIWLIVFLREHSRRLAWAASEGYRQIMSKSAHVRPTRPRIDDPDDSPVSADELAVVRKRDKTYDRDREAAKPAGEVVERLLARYPAP